MTFGALPAGDTQRCLHNCIPVARAAGDFGGDPDLLPADPRAAFCSDTRRVPWQRACLAPHGAPWARLARPLIKWSSKLDDRNFPRERL